MTLKRDPAGVLIGGIYVLTAAGLLAVPLLNTLHAEAGAVLAALAFFVSGLSAISSFRSGARSLLGEIVRHLAFLLLPLVMYQLPRLWTSGCDFSAGLLFFVLFPVIGVVFAVSLSWMLTGTRIRQVRLVFVLVGIAILLLPPLYDLGFHPQFYTYNHVFGGILGPIYDLELAIRPGLFWFRGLTLLWASLAVIVGYRLRRRRTGALVVAGPVVVAAIVLSYLFADRLGFNTSYERLDALLGSSIPTEHFVIHYDSSSVSERRVAEIAADHDFRFAQMADRLGFRPDALIHTYLYPTAAERADLTGAGYTSIAPVWLSRPQIHILLDVYGRSFTHELAHVFSREIGLPVLNTSLNVGLIEGFAVALEPPDGLPGPHELVAAVLQDTSAASFDREELVGAVASTMSPFGFWTGRGAVSYTTMGSFVTFLIDGFGTESFGAVFKVRDFESVYGIPVESLARQWVDELEELEVEPGTLDLATARFSVLSLFERRCPHDIPPALCQYREAESDLANGDTLQAIAQLEKAIEAAPEFQSALWQWAKLILDEWPEKSGQVVSRLEPVWNSSPTDVSPLIGLYLGNAFAALGEVKNADTTYTQVLERSSPYARDLRAKTRLHRTLLEAGPDSTAAAVILSAIDLAELEEYGQAIELMLSVERSDASTGLGERYHSWLAGFAFRAGRLVDSERFRRTAVEVAGAEGDELQVARLRDFGQRIEWAERHITRGGS